MDKKIFYRDEDDKDIILYIRKKAVLFLILLVLFFVLMAFVISYLSRPDVTDYIEVKAVGYDGKGKITFFRN